MGNSEFEVIFFDSEERVVHHYSGGGGGGSSSRRTIYKNQTEFVNITSYLDREVIKEVKGDEIITEVRKTSWWTWLLLFGIISILGWISVSYFVQRRNTDTDERGFE